ILHHSYAVASHALTIRTHRPIIIIITITSHPPHIPSYPTRRSSHLTKYRNHLTTSNVDARHFRPSSHAHPQELSAPNQLPSDKEDRKSTRLNSSHVSISYAVFCLKKKIDVIYW